MVRPKRICVFIVAAFLSLAALPAPACAGMPLVIEQVQVNLPDVRVFFSMPIDWGESDTAEAKLGGDELELRSVRRLDPQTDGAWCFYLVDCSGSVKAAQMEAIKAALRAAADEMNENDVFTLIAFGESVEMLLNRETDVQAIYAAIDTLRADQKETRFYDAVSAAVTLADDKEYALERKLLYAFTDSIDENLGGATTGELERMLDQTALPIYALGLDTGKKADLDAFGALARYSGGSIEIVSAGTLVERFASMSTYNRSAFVAEFTASTNIVSASHQPFEITFVGTTSVSSRDVAVKHWQPDVTPPTIASAKQLNEGTLRVDFSEAVQGENIASNYVVRDAAGNLLGIAAAASVASGTAAELTLANVPLSGTLLIECPGITDLSMEKNPVKGSCSLAFVGAKPEPSTTPALVTAQPAEPAKDDSAMPIGAWFALGAVLVVGMIAAIFAVIKKNGGLVMSDGKLHFGKDTVVEQLNADQNEVQVHFVSAQLPVLHMTVIAPSGDTHRLDLPVNQSAFFGRGDLCDVCFDDTEMSRQHFVIEARDDTFILSNLSETNGTLINGVPVRNPRRLISGDRIQAGQQVLIFSEEG